MHRDGSGYNGSQPLSRGIYHGPRVEIVDKRGTMLRTLCWGCDRRVHPSERSCPQCGRSLSGTERRTA